MKIVQVIYSLGLGGAETVVENISKVFLQKGHQVVILSFYDLDSPRVERLQNAGADIRFLGKKPGFDVKTLKKVHQILKEEKPDVIHSHLNVIKYVALSGFCTKKTANIHTIHNVAYLDATGLDKLLNKILFKWFNVVPVALSEKIQKTITEYYKINPSKLPIVLNGADLSKCVDKTDYKFGELIKLIHVGRFTDQKNHIEMLKAFEEVNKKYPNTVLQLVGDGENREIIENYIYQNSLQNAVELLGLTENVFQYLNKADIFLLPSLYEGLPITLIEAMGCGLPCVTSKVGGIPDIIEDGKNGIFCEPFCDSIASKLIEFIENEQLRKTCGINAKETAKNFSAERMGAGYEKLYKQILGR